MPKIGPNKVSIDPKAYAARITRAKKIVAGADPATKAKLKEMYPNISKETIANKALDTKKATMKKSKSMEKMPARRVPEGFEFPKTTKKPMPKLESAKPGVKKPMPKVAGAKPGARTPMSKTITKAPAKMTPKPKVTKKPEKMTPQDAAMKKIPEGKYGKIYG